MEQSYDALFQLRDYNNYTLLGLIGDSVPLLIWGERSREEGLSGLQSEKLNSTLPKARICLTIYHD